MTKLPLVAVLTVSIVAAFWAVATESAEAQAPANPPPQGSTQQPKADAKKDDSVKNAPRKRVVSDLSGFDLLGSGKQPIVVGATRSLTRPTALAPHLARVYELTPLFSWSSTPDSGQVLFVLEDEARRQIFQKEVQGSSFRYPGGAPPLEPGKTYFWSVAISLGSLGSVQSDRVGFLVLSPGERKAIEKDVVQVSSADAYQQALDRARVLTNHRLWYDAIAAYTDLIARFPKQAVLYEERGTIYAQIEATQALSDQDFARADTLTAKQP